MSLVPHFRRQIAEVRGISRVINYGVNKVRFPNAVCVGARVRGVQTIQAVTRIAPESVRLVSQVLVEIEGETKPGCVADTVSLLYE